MDIKPEDIKHLINQEVPISDLHELYSAAGKPYLPIIRHLLGVIERQEKYLSLMMENQEEHPKFNEAWNIIAESSAYVALAKELKIVETTK